MTRRLFVLATVVFATCGLAGPAAGQAKKEDKKGWFGIQIRGEADGTITITEVFNNSPAETAGLKAGDVILKINGVKPANLRTAVAVIGALKPKQKVKVQVLRQKKEMEVTVVVGER
jgi:S1-C subfamily serine protease